MPLASGDWIRWTRDEPVQDIVAGRRSRILKIEGRSLHLRDRDGGQLVMHADHPAFRHSDYAFNLSRRELDNGRFDNVVAVMNTALPPISHLFTVGREVDRRKGNALLVTDDQALLNRLLVKAGGKPLELREGQKVGAEPMRR